MSTKLPKEHRKRFYLTLPVFIYMVVLLRGCMQKSCYSLGFSTIFSLMYVLASLKYRDFWFYVVHLMENYSKSIAFYIFGERWGKGCSCSNFSVCVQSENNTSRRRLKTPESTSSDFLRFLPSSVKFSSFSAIEL